MSIQQREQGGFCFYPFIMLNLTIGLSCAIPAYLYGREPQVSPCYQP